MTQDSFWKNNPLLMMSRAHGLGQLAERLEAEQSDGEWCDGTFVAIPVLLSLAAEIGLKAWCRIEGTPGPKTHDLLKLFDGLGENTRRRLENRMPEFPSPVPGLPPAYPGIKDALRQNRDVFTEWRYAHEHDGLIAETGVLKTALKAIVDKFIDEMPSENRLEG